LRSRMPLIITSSCSVAINLASFSHTISVLQPTRALYSSLSSWEQEKVNIRKYMGSDK
jgi:hypothetical protein